MAERYPAFQSGYTAKVTQGIEVRAETLESLKEYASIPIAFVVQSRLDLSEDAGGLRLAPKPVPPYVKDYDAYPGNGPLYWADSWDLSNWGFLGAYCGGERIGGCALAWSTDGVEILEGRSDLAVVWDLRVHPASRAQGCGKALLLSADRWAKARGCEQLKVETQDINIPAGRLYAAHGFRLRQIVSGVYLDFPDELQLLWYKSLAKGG